ncbi:MAG: CocE/NonD family hydrolase [Gammaproteobacteria bacterium]|nr:CocE/NonD family hydrolase [Gammaproteobacteria bacterium]MDH5215159.1 CocE/NonD family hydrolase [Gammaproteobacteria bacterium]
MHYKEYRRIIAGLTASALALLAACSPQNDESRGAAPVAADYAVQKNIEVPMRDGVILRADIYLPPGEGPFPVLLYRTPYSKSDAAETYRTHLNAVSRGYAVIMQDVRGRYASDGFFEPYRNEGRDGYDTIEWAAVQPWSNGDVGSFGLSYPGAVQWLAAIESPPRLVAMAPAMTYSTPRKFFYMNGAFDLSWLPWIYQYIAPDARVRLDMPGIRTDAEAEQMWPKVRDDYESFLPLAELPYLRKEAPYYFEWMKHPPEHSWWDWAEIRTRYDDVDAAVLNLSGWHDDSYGTEGAATNFNGLVASRSASANSRTRLVIGPWKHGVAATAQQQVGELDFGATAAIDYDDLILDFFDQHMRKLDSGQRDAAAVRYFVMGENRWREAATWPPADTAVEQLCFGAGSATAMLGDCSKPSEVPFSRFVADPADPVSDPYAARGPHDYSMVASRPDVLIFESAALDESLSIAGNAVARVYVSCNCRDFDLWVRMLDVYPDGRAMNLMSPGADSMRASYRDIANGRKLLEPGEVYEITLDGLLTANRFAAGHRVQLQVSATFAPHLSRNLQTGESEMTSAESKAAEITIHHSEQYRSSLTLPVLEQ